MFLSEPAFRSASRSDTHEIETSSRVLYRDEGDEFEYAKQQSPTGLGRESHVSAILLLQSISKQQAATEGVLNIEVRARVSVRSASRACGALRWS
jgi:hypothetical protein